MQLTYDEMADAVYVYFNQAPIDHTEEIHDGTAIVDYDADGVPVGVEFMDVSEGIDLRRVPRADEIARLLEDYPFPVMA
ncbi:MAG TPA: DUF2283 domain-containing protein [Vicinamibacterales bacterium]|nr:DUF2283 domain-containing protein [Vicinamibacterales bacterium]